MATSAKKKNADAPLIMVVEDDRAYASVFERKLKMEGFNVVVSNTSEGVVDLVAKQPPSLMLLDLVLPGKSGFELLEELRADKKNDHIKIIISSNLSQSVDRQKATHAGADDYFIKSNISVNEMVERVKRALSQKSARL